MSSLQYINSEIQVRTINSRTIREIKVSNDLEAGPQEGRGNTYSITGLEIEAIETIYYLKESYLQ